MHVIGIGSNKVRRHVDLVEMPDEEWDTVGATLHMVEIPIPDTFAKHTFRILGHYVTADPADIEPGCQFLAGCVVAFGAKLGRHCIINHNAVVDHDCVLGDYVHVAPGAIISGGATIGEGALIGPGASVGIGAAVPPWAIVRANSVFPHDYYQYTPRKAGTRKLRTLQFDYPVE